MRMPTITAAAITITTALTLLPATVAQAQSRQDARDDAECQSYGATPGSDAYVSCRIRLKQRLDDQIRGMFNHGPVYVPPTPVAPTRDPQSCITNYVGGNAYRYCN